MGPPEKKQNLLTRVHWEGSSTSWAASPPAEVAACNDCLDTIPWEPGTEGCLQPGDWWGGVQAHNYGAGGFWKDGLNLQQMQKRETWAKNHIDWWGKPTWKWDPNEQYNAAQFYTWKPSTIPGWVCPPEHTISVHLDEKPVHYGTL